MDLHTQATAKHDEARVAHAAVATEWEARITSLPEDATVEDITAVNDEFSAKLDEAEAEVKRTKELVDQMTQLAEARKASAGLIPAGSLEVREAPTYEKDNPYSSYFNDLYRYQKYSDRAAFDRLQRNGR